MKLEIKNGNLCVLQGENTVYEIKKGDVIGEIGNKSLSYKMSHGSFSIKEKKGYSTKWIVHDIVNEGEQIMLNMNVGKICADCLGDILRFEPKAPASFDYMKLFLKSNKNECFYGGGELFSEFNLKGKKLRVWVAEHINALGTAKKLVKRTFGIKDDTKSADLSKYETYYAQPTFISSNKYFFHSEATSRAVFDFKKDDLSVIEINSFAPFYFGIADDFEKLLCSLTSLVGRQPELPEWVYEGQILGIQGGTEVMLEKYEKAKKTNAAVCGIWIQDWEGRRVTAVGKQLFWNWQVDDELYPNLKEKIAELNAQGVKVLGYINPFLAMEKPLYKEASQKGYCVKNDKGEDYYVTITTFPAAMIDLTNPAAVDWIKGIIKSNMIDLGLSGWMADFGEYLPTDAVLFSGEDAEQVHNTWPARWARVNREAVEEAGKLGEIMFFTRAGYSDTPRYSTMMWNGDNHVDFSLDYGLASVIPAMLTLTCCGFGLSHSDIGGYTTFANLRRSKELYMRWCEMNAFSPLMRGHEGLNPDLNAQFDFDDEVLAHGAKFSRIHQAIAPYLKRLVKENAETGVGVVRPLFFYYNEKQAYEEKFEYLLGRDVLVAPVIRPGKSTREVYLPNDEWINIFTGKTYTGGSTTVYAPIGRIPVFVRKNADEQTVKLFTDLIKFNNFEPEK